MFLEKYTEQIKFLCENHKVKSLYAFGSVLTNKFSDASDIDLVIEIDSADPIEYAENYFDFKFSLEKLLNKNIDLLEEKAINNPFFRKAIESTKAPVYVR